MHPLITNTYLLQQTGNGNEDNHSKRASISLSKRLAGSKLEGVTGRY
jgi:hypothetical protein